MPATLPAVLAPLATCCSTSLATPLPSPLLAIHLDLCPQQLLAATPVPWWRHPLATAAASLAAAEQLPPEWFNPQKNVWEVNSDQATNNHDHNQTLSQANMFMLSYFIRGQSEPLCLTSTQFRSQFEIIRTKRLSLQLLDMLSNRSKSSSQLHISSIQLAIKQLPTFPASEARYASNASRSSGTVSNLLFDLTGNPAAFAIARNSSRPMSATAPCSHSGPLMAPSSRNRCSFSRSCRATASRVV